MWLKCCWIFFKDFKRLKSRLLMIYVAIYVAIARWLLFRAAMVGVARAVSCRQSSRAHSRRWVRTTDAPTLKKFSNTQIFKSRTRVCLLYVTESDFQCFVPVWVNLRFIVPGPTFTTEFLQVSVFSLILIRRCRVIVRCLVTQSTSRFANARKWFEIICAEILKYSLTL